MSASVKDADSIRVRERAVRVDSVPEADKSSRYEKLTDADFRMVAEELGVEVAAIKAVVSIEAGAAMKGFWAPGVPVINFDRAMYNRFRSKVSDKAAPKGEGPSGAFRICAERMDTADQCQKGQCAGREHGNVLGNVPDRRIQL